MDFFSFFRKKQTPALQMLPLKVPAFHDKLLPALLQVFQF